jgi:hypothetical protein
VIELLAITDDATPLEPPLRAVRCDGLSVVCAPAAEGEVDAEALWKREAVVERLMEDRDLLPVRYGTVVQDERAAVAAVAPQSEALARALDRVRGAVELAVRAVAADAQPAEPAAGASGRDYLRERVAHERLARALHEPLAAAARDSVVQDGPGVLRAAYLVARGDVDGFVTLFRALQREHQALAIVCTGPWPPYSFTGGGAT